MLLLCRRLHDEERTMLELLTLWWRLLTADSKMDGGAPPPNPR
jgi:hypothetical protein